MRVINTELYDEDAALGATPELLVGNGAPDGDAEPQASAPKGSIYIQMDATDDTMPLWVKVDSSGTDEDWVRLLAEKCTDSDVEIDGDWLWLTDKGITFRGSGGDMSSPNPAFMRISPDIQLHIGGADDYMAFDDAGMMFAVGNAAWHSDHDYPVGSWLEAVAGNPPDYVTLENMAAGSFDIGDEVYLVVRIPWGYVTGQSPYLQIQLFWWINEAYATNSGEVQFQVDLNAVTTDETEAVDSAGTEGTYKSGDIDIPATAKAMTVSAIDVTGEIEHDEIAGIKVSRVALDGGNNPTEDPCVCLIRVRYVSAMVGRGLNVDS